MESSPRIHQIRCSEHRPFYSFLDDAVLLQLAPLYKSNRYNFNLRFYLLLMNSRARHIPSPEKHHEDLRHYRRWKAREHDTVYGVQLLHARNTDFESRPGKLSPLMTSLPPMPKQRLDLSSTLDKRTARLNTPGSRISESVTSIMNDNAVLGSSQLEDHVCHGDFCDENAGLIADDSHGDFRRRLISTDTFSNGIKLRSIDRLMSASTPSLVLKDKQSTPLVSIPYRAVIQAREEMPLVKLLLRRHQRGENGDYITAENYNDITLGSVLPGQYYKDVPCCLNCFKIYGLISEARDAAVAKLANKRAQSPTAPALVNTLAYPSGSGAPSFRASNQPVQIINDVTKSDIAELRALHKPPLAVQVVMEAVHCVLHGKLQSFEKIRHLLLGAGSADALLSAMQGFRLADLSRSRIEMLTPYTDNALFRPDKVASSSLCASKLCGWVLAVVRAAKLHHLSVANSGALEIGTSPRVSETFEDRKEERFIIKATRDATKKRQVNTAERLMNVVSNDATDFRCSDGITKMPFLILGSRFQSDFTAPSKRRHSFVVFHDYFDTCDATAIALKAITKRHDGSQVLCFNYPGQANTVWPRLSPQDRERGVPDINMNNDWISDRIHELLQYLEHEGTFTTQLPFHIIGIGNGSCIAAAFCQKYGSEATYSKNLKSFVSINGYLFPDPQLASILSSAEKMFEATPHYRPDIPVSFWSRYLFSDDYLGRVKLSLALNIYTAVSNPITNEGRTKIARGSLHHRDLRSGLAPDLVPKSGDLFTSPFQKPLIIIQSTENLLVNPSNVDTFLVGRTTRHLWSHQLNIPTQRGEGRAVRTASESHCDWVGSLTTTIEARMYHKSSILGKVGLRMLSETLNNSRGALVVWCRAGHALFQENKAYVLDVMDALAFPDDELLGLLANTNSGASASSVADVDAEVRRVTEKIEVLFKLSPPLSRGASPSSVGIEALRSEEKASSPDVEASTSVEQTDSDAMMDSGPKKDPAQYPSSPLERHHILESIPDLNEPFVFSELPSKILNSMEMTPHESLQSTVNAAVKDGEHSFEVNSNEFRNYPVSGVSEIPDCFDPSSTPAASLPFNSSIEQREKKEWSSLVPSVSGTFELEASLGRRQMEYMGSELEAKKRKADAATARIKSLEEEQERRRQQYVEEDRKLLENLQRELEVRRRERELAERQRHIQIQEIEHALVTSGMIPGLNESRSESLDLPIREMPPLIYKESVLPDAVSNSVFDSVNQLDAMVADEEEARKRGIMSMKAYDDVKRQMEVRQIERDEKLRQLDLQEREKLYKRCALNVQRVWRGFLGRKVAFIAASERRQRLKLTRAVVRLQAHYRGCLGRQRASIVKWAKLMTYTRGTSCLLIQSVYRAHLARKHVAGMRRNFLAIEIQRVFRGHLGKRASNRERTRLAALLKKQTASRTIQSAWRMKICKEEFRSLRVHSLAATEIQRRYRGYLGRKRTERRRRWEKAVPGPDRIKLGLEFIEESRAAFEKQQEEISSLHRAQEKAESRVSKIYTDLKDSEKELLVLERELQEIDQIERDLQVLTHERDLLTHGIGDAVGMPRTANRGNQSLVLGHQTNIENDPDISRRRKAEAYALEMTIQIKRAEREKRRQELETEFAAVFQEVDKKRKALARLESALADMEATRERKDREFRRLQKNLIQLLLEQKEELDELRERGIELETATATTAAAATATAWKAKEHEERSKAMFSQTEELMKFQFMSMSLSYFSSLNMLKQFRDMNADTTSAAIASSADAAAAAAAAATAASLPSIKKLNLGADLDTQFSIRNKRNELKASEESENAVKKARVYPLPENVRIWSVADVGRWLETLSLGQYVEAFRLAVVDGAFLMELRDEDLVQVLGISHKLHVRKIILSRERLKPLSEQERAARQRTELDLQNDMARKKLGVPDLDTVFSQVRNGRIKRVEESLNLGFSINSEDEKGNTMLLVAAQNSNRKLIEMLIIRGANVNHQNAQGNTALHFALSFDPEGALGEYLIEHGADDSLENVEGLTAYDGIASAVAPATSSLSSNQNAKLAQALLYQIVASVKDSTLLLADGVPVRGTVADLGVDYFRYSVTVPDADVTVSLTPFSDGDVDLIIGLGFLPTAFNYTSKSAFVGRDFITVQAYTIAQKCGDVLRKPCNMFVGVLGWSVNASSSFSYSLVAMTEQGFRSRVTLLDGQPQRGAVKFGHYTYYQFSIRRSSNVLVLSSITISLLPISSDLDLHVSFSGQPGRATGAYDYASTQWGGVSETIVVSPAMKHFCTQSDIFIAVFGASVETDSARFVLMASFDGLVMLQGGRPIVGSMIIADPPCLNYYAFFSDRPFAILDFALTLLGGDADIFISTASASNSSTASLLSKLPSRSSFRWKSVRYGDDSVRICFLLLIVLLPDRLPLFPSRIRRRCSSEWQHNTAFSLALPRTL